MTSRAAAPEPPHHSCEHGLAHSEDQARSRIHALLFATVRLICQGNEAFAQGRDELLRVIDELGKAVAKPARLREPLAHERLRAGAHFRRQVDWPQTSRFWTWRARALMKSRRGSTFSPISVLKMRSASAASSISAWSRVRVAGLIVVSQS